MVGVAVGLESGVGVAPGFVVGVTVGLAAGTVGVGVAPVVGTGVGLVAGTVGVVPALLFGVLLAPLPLPFATTVAIAVAVVIRITRVKRCADSYSIAIGCHCDRIGLIQQAHAIQPIGSIAGNEALREKGKERITGCWVGRAPSSG